MKQGDVTHDSGPRLASWRLRLEGAIQPKGSVSAFGYTDKATGKVRASVVHKRSLSSERSLKDGAARALAADARLAGAVASYYDFPVSVLLIVVFEAPGWARKLHKPILKGAHKRPPMYPLHRTRPDGDKLLRTTLDALQGVAFRDDAQVVDKRCVKLYTVGDQRPHTIIEICYYGREYEQPPAELLGLA